MRRLVAVRAIGEEQHVMSEVVTASVLALSLKPEGSTDDRGAPSKRLLHWAENGHEVGFGMEREHSLVCRSGYRTEQSS